MRWRLSSASSGNRSQLRSRYVSPGQRKSARVGRLAAGEVGRQESEHSVTLCNRELREYPLKVVEGIDANEATSSDDRVDNGRSPAGLGVV